MQASPEDSGDEGNGGDRRRSSSRRKNKKGSISPSRDPEPSKSPNMLQVVDRNSQNAVNSAAKELRRNYSKKVVDKLSFLTKNSLKILSKHFASASTDVKNEVYFLNSSLHLFPKIFRYLFTFVIGYRGKCLYYCFYSYCLLEHPRY